MPPSTRSTRTKAASTTLVPSPFRRRKLPSRTPDTEYTVSKASVSPSLAPTPLTSVQTTPEPANTDNANGVELGEQEESDDETMYSPTNEKAGLRGRNVEDLGDFQEKGILRPSTSPDGLDDGQMSPRRRAGKGKELNAEKVQEFFEVVKGEGRGLDNPRDRHAFALLILLYLLQGIPLGLTFGTLPFLLKPHLSYSQLAVFALSTWPYSLKLLWSPIVDAWFVHKWGRRKSWIIPVQGIVGIGMWIIGGSVENWLEAEAVDVRFITAVFGSLILAAATQDIAVDGWALTLLSPSNLSYASTAQTIGLGIGNALSFTVFLAFNSVDFSNKYFRSEPIDHGLVSLGGYMRFWAVVYIFVTVCLARFKTEDPVSSDEPDMDVKKVYSVMWSIIRLKNIQSFLLILLISKIGFQVNESVTSLKLLEKGLSREDLAVAVLLDFPAQMIAGWLAAKWSRPSGAPARHPLSGQNQPTSQVLRPWIWAFWARLTMAAVAAGVVWAFPLGDISSGYFGLVIATTLLSSLASTVQFVGITAFFTQIADPLIGGTYMTLLNTVSNLGGTWPKPLVLRSVDVLTVATCSSRSHRGECVTEHGKGLCSQGGGECVIERDGYYLMSGMCVALGAALLVSYILPNVKRLQSLPMSAWRVKIPH